MRRTTLALLLLGATTPAWAQMPAPPTSDDAPAHPGGPRRGGMLMRADTNGDGMVTRADAIAAADARFDRLDANRDGTVTPEEMQAARLAMRGGDGSDRPPPRAADGARPDRPRPIARTMTRDESRARALEAFTRADTNGDATVDKAELARDRPPRDRGPRPDGDTPGEGRSN